jgi:hypothetical protein
LTEAPKSNAAPPSLAASTSAAAALSSYVESELGQSVPSAALGLVDEIRERHGDAVSAVLFYGSCLRKDTLEGVLDFYVVVDSYGETYSSLYLRVANALVPPNVFFLSHETNQATLRCKYAVVSRSDLERGTGPESVLPYFWARFAQPVRLVFARDDEAHRFAVDCCRRSVVTLVRRLTAFLPAHHDIQRFSSAALWHEAFRRTYGSELRTESEETVRGNYDADSDRFDMVGGLALDELLQSGWISELARRGASFEIRMPQRRRLAARWRWQLERPLCKLVAFVRLLKNTTTFGDWVPYILWKLERHTGRPIEVSERQRRHPLVFGWPVLFRLLWNRDIF